MTSKRTSARATSTAAHRRGDVAAYVPGGAVLPHDASAEASILGGILLNNEVLALLADLEPDDFYHPKHKIVFSAIRDLQAKNEPIDVVTLESHIAARGKLEAIDGTAFLGELALHVPTPDNVEAYQRIVVNHRIKRDVALRLAELQARVHDADTSGEELVSEVQRVMMDVRAGKQTPIVSMGQLAADEAQRFMNDLDARERGEHVFTGVPTGVHALDQRVGGHPIGVMTLYIARPAVGKTTHAMNVCRGAVRGMAGEDSLLCSLEDRDRSFGQRALAQESGIPTERIRARSVADGYQDYYRRQIMRGAANALRHRTEKFADCTGMEVEDIVRMVRREQAKRAMLGRPRIRQVVVDYLQKVKWPAWARGSEEAVGHISNVLSTWAGTDDLAVVALCQLNRNVESREDHKPRMSDIRDSGRLEQDGKLILGIYYGHRYEPHAYAESHVDLLVIKNAQGASDFEIPLYWDVHTHSIHNDEQEYLHACQARGSR